MLTPCQSGVQKISYFWSQEEPIKDRVEERVFPQTSKDQVDNKDPDDNKDPHDNKNPDDNKGQVDDKDPDDNIDKYPDDTNDPDDKKEEGEAVIKVHVNVITCDKTVLAKQIEAIAEQRNNNNNEAIEQKYVDSCKLSISLQQ